MQILIFINQNLHSFPLDLPCSSVQRTTIFLFDLRIHWSTSLCNFYILPSADYMSWNFSKVSWKYSLIFVPMQKKDTSQDQDEISSKSEMLLDINKLCPCVLMEPLWAWGSSFPRQYLGIKVPFFFFFFYFLYPLTYLGFLLYPFNSVDKLYPFLVWAAYVLVIKKLY